MDEVIVAQGRRLSPEDVNRVRELICTHPEWSRRRLSEELALEWEWRNGAGRLKDMAARTLLLKLEARGLVRLPARRQRASSRMAGRRIEPLRETPPVRGKLGALFPLTVREVSGNPGRRAEFDRALAGFHYLGHRGAVGENLSYTVSDREGRLLACLLFGSAAWKCRARDEFIGWDAGRRAGSLPLVTNNSRFLILPGVEVPHLASWALGRVLRRLSRDWDEKYGHPIVLVETFVERPRFRGTCYRAANWLRLGSTAGRGRQDRRHHLRVPVKDIYVYPLRRDFREALGV